jgi:hypothetical protein
LRTKQGIRNRGGEGTLNLTLSKENELIEASMHTNTRHLSTPIIIIGENN